MTASTGEPLGRPRRLFAQLPVLVAAATLIVLLVLYWSIDPSALAATSTQSLVNEGAGAGLAAMGEAVIVLCGGLDLSVGAILSLLNVVLAAQMHSSPGSEWLVSIEAVLAGIAVSAINGTLVAVLRLPSILVTLAMSFFWAGVALLVMSQPGGNIGFGFTQFLSGEYLGVIPNAVFLLAVAFVVWHLFKRTGFGRAMYAVGANTAGARANGIPVARVSIASYALAGFFYGLAALSLTAVSGSGDPNIGTPLVITTFAAVVLGGVALGGGRGDAAAALIGAYIIAVITDILFVAGVPAFYTDIFNGGVLLIAVAAGSLFSRRRDLAGAL
jgi:ribose transport system permease protein